MQVSEEGCIESGIVEVKLKMKLLLFCAKGFEWLALLV